jgi:hypothetical protein
MARRERRDLFENGGMAPTLEKRKKNRKNGDLHLKALKA